MTLAETLEVVFRYREALAFGLILSLLAALVVTPRTISKLKGAKIVGRDINKPGRPLVPEMGGLAVFLAFNVGAFTTLGLGDIPRDEQVLIFASLIVAAGALITGVLDDLVVLRQRFKAAIPFAFALPLALFVPGSEVTFPLVGVVDFGLVYPIVLVPLGVACAANGFNMLEGFNGLGAGLGIIMAAGLGIMALAADRLTGLAILFPLVGALGGFLWFNVYPARIFPGDTMTLVVGAVLGSAVILSGLEFWGALLFLPHVVEFFLKATGGFKAESFASRVDEDGRLHYDGPIQSLTHFLLRTGRETESSLVFKMWMMFGLYTVLVVGAFYVVEGPRSDLVDRLRELAANAGWR